MPRIKIVDSEEATGLRRLLIRIVQRQFGGMVPGIMRVLMPGFRIMDPHLLALRSPQPAQGLAHDPPAARDARHRG